MDALDVTPTPANGVIRVTGRGLPVGDVVLVRSADHGPEEVRGGSFHVETGGFLRLDPEGPFGKELTYTVTDAVDDRHVQTNLVTNPRAAVDTADWATGTGRTLTREDAVDLVPPRDSATSFRVSAYPAGGTLKTLDDRLLGSTIPVGLGPGRWFVTGQVQYDSPDTWLWLDARAAGTWQTVKNKGTWQAVRSVVPLGASDPFASIWAAVISAARTWTERRRNRVPNPALAAATTGWFGNVGTGGAVTVSRPTTGGPTNGAFYRQTYTTGNTSGAGVDPAASIVADGRASSALPIPVVAGTAYSAGIQTRTSVAQRIACTIQWYDAANVLLGSSPGTASVLVANTWTRLVTENATAPAGAAYARIAATTMAGTGVVPFPVGATFDVTQAILVAASTAGTYFDGTTAATAQLQYAWTGAANASASTESISDYTTHVAPFQLIGVSVFGQQTWQTFQAWIDIPAAMPAGSRLAFLHGTADREFSTTFWLTTVMVTPEAEVDEGSLVYFDGDSVLPDNPAANMAAGYDWEDASGDAVIEWTGTPNASTSVFTGPSVITASKKTLFPVPDQSVTGARLPVLLSDPVAAVLSQWFELLGIGALTNPSRNNEFDVLGRRDRIGVSQVRGRETGQLVLMTYTQQQETVAERMFGYGRILLLRNPDPRFPENGWYLLIGDVGRDRVGADATRPERAWTVPFTRVARPVGLIEATTSVTWVAIRDTAVTWEGLRNSTDDWLDVATTGPAPATSTVSAA